MQLESLSSPPAFEARAASQLELALARVVARARDDFAVERRAMAAEMAAAHAALEAALVQAADARKEFLRLADELAELKAAARGEPGERGQDGAPGAPGQRGEPGERGPQGEPGAAGERGQDGAQGRDGASGERGPEGPAGLAGRDGLPGVPGAQGERGRDGRDGVDGLGFNAARQFADDREFGLEFLLGDQVVYRCAWPRPTLADFHCGPYHAGEKYARGQCVTYGGSTFLCLRDTKEKPSSVEDWREIVKKGLPGRNGADGDRGPAGPAGRDGLDLTQMTSGGLKYG